MSHLASRLYSGNDLGERRIWLQARDIEVELPSFPLGPTDTCRRYRSTLLILFPLSHVTRSNYLFDRADHFIIQLVNRLGRAVGPRPNYPIL